eukprot:221659-Pleurochrysis_carterae.AAC.4
MEARTGQAGELLHARRRKPASAVTSPQSEQQDLTRTERSATRTSGESRMQSVMYRVCQVYGASKQGRECSLRGFVRAETLPYQGYEFTTQPLCNLKDVAHHQAPLFLYTKARPEYRARRVLR